MLPCLFIPTSSTGGINVTFPPFCLHKVRELSTLLPRAMTAKHACSAHFTTEPIDLCSCAQAKEPTEIPWLQERAMGWWQPSRKAICGEGCSTRGAQAGKYLQVWFWKGLRESSLRTIWSKNNTNQNSYCFCGGQFQREETNHTSVDIYLVLGLANKESECLYFWCGYCSKLGAQATALCLQRTENANTVKANW